MKKKLSFLLLFILLSSFSYALTLEVSSTTDDSDIEVSIGTISDRTITSIKSGEILSTDYRSFFDFNISALPSNAIVSSVVLKLRVDTTTDLETITIRNISSHSSTYTSPSTNLVTECGAGGIYATHAWTTTGDYEQVSLTGTAISDTTSKDGNFSICLQNINGETTTNTYTQFMSNNSATPAYVPKLIITYTSADPLNTSEPHINLDSQETNISIGYMSNVSVDVWGINGTANLFSNITGSVALTSRNTSFLLGVGTYNFTVQINGTDTFQGSNQTWQVNVTKTSAPLNLSKNGTLLTSNTNYTIWEDQLVLFTTNNDTGFGILAINATHNITGSKVIIIASNESTTQNYSSTLLNGLDFIEVNITLNSTSTYNFSQTNTSYYFTINRSKPTWTSFSPSFTAGSSVTINLTNYITHPTDSQFTYTSNNASNFVTISGDLATFSGSNVGTDILQINVSDLSGDNASLNISVTVTSANSGGTSGGSSGNSYTVIKEETPPIVEEPEEVIGPQISPIVEEEPIVEETEEVVEEQTSSLKDDITEVQCTENCDAFYDNLLEQMKDVQDKIELTKNTYYDEETDRTITNITLKIKEDLKDFEYVQSVPKCMAIAAYLIEFNEPPTQILKDDPLIAWQFADIKAGTELDLSFDVLGNIPEDCYNLVDELFYEKQSPPNYKNIIIASIISLLIVGSVIYALWPAKVKKKKSSKKKK